MKKKIYAFLLLFFVVPVVFLVVKNYSIIKANYYIVSYQEKELGELIAPEKYLLFSSYFKVGRDLDALKVTQSLVNNKDELVKTQVIDVAYRTGMIFRANQQPELEVSTYEEFLKGKYDGYYNLFMADYHRYYKRDQEYKDFLLRASKIFNSVPLEYLKDYDKSIIKDLDTAIKQLNEG